MLLHDAFVISFLDAVIRSLILAADQFTGVGGMKR
jgi:hypothetical protein